MRHFVDIKPQTHLRILNASVPLCCIPTDSSLPSPTIDSLALVDINIVEGKVIGIHAARGSAAYANHDVGIVDLRHGMILPTFVDLHTHIGDYLDGTLCNQRPLKPQQSEGPEALFSSSYSSISQHQAVLQTRLRQESAVVMLMVPFLGLTVAQPAMLSFGTKMMCTGDTL